MLFFKKNVKILKDHYLTNQKQEDCLIIKLGILFSDIQLHD